MVWLIDFWLICFISMFGPSTALITNCPLAILFMDTFTAVLAAGFDVVFVADQIFQNSSKRLPLLP